MKKMIFILIAIVALSAMAFAQGGKQPLPNFIGKPETTATNIFGHGFPVGTFTGGVQGVRAGMLKGPHDFTRDSGRVAGDTVKPVGTNNRLCSFCHSIHIPKTGIANPLWSRKSVAGQTFGKYDNPSSLDATVYDPGTTAAGFQDNYSSMCLSCHDGSAGIFSAAKYEGGGGQGTSETDHAPDNVSFGATGELALSHTHPVNFDYNAVQALVPEELYPAVDPVSAVWKGYSGSNGVGGNYTTVRLFNGTMQCSSCHNPHMASGIGTVLSSDYGRRCVACHKK